MKSTLLMTNLTTQFAIFSFFFPLGMFLKFIKLFRANINYWFYLETKEQTFDVKQCHKHVISFGIINFFLSKGILITLSEKYSKTGSGKQLSSFDYYSADSWMLIK